MADPSARDRQEPAAEAPTRLPWPPLLLVGLLIAGGVLNWAAPVRFLPAAGWLWPAAAVAIGLAGVALAAAALVEFRRAATTVRVDRPTTALVETGIFRRTRNPIYLAMALVLLAFAVAFNSLWLLLAVPVFLVLVHKLAIEPEEAHLERRFGDAYDAYRRRVPRWL